GRCWTTLLVTGYPAPTSSLMSMLSHCSKGGALRECASNSAATGVPGLPNESKDPRAAAHVHSADCNLSHSCVLKMDLMIPARESAITPLVESVMAAARETHIGEDKELEIETSLRE